MTSKGRAKRRRKILVRKLREAAGVDRGLAEHMHDSQIEPQRRAAELRAAGHDVAVALASTSPDAPGHEVRCAGCGRTARLPVAPPAGRVVLCPACQRSRA